MPPSPTRLLLIFLKEPVEGKVKTRIAQTAGAEQAVNIYKSLVSTLLTQLKWIPNCHYRFCFAPADAEEAIKFWLLPDLNHRMEGPGLTPLDDKTPSVDFVAQPDGDLGDRLESAFKQGFDDGFEQVSAIGSDCPFLSASWIDIAYRQGKKSDVTIGPTPDGGYCLINLNTFTTAPFREIPWSAENTLEATLAKVEQAGLSVQLLPELTDIDHEEDWLQALETPLGPKLKKNLPKK